MAKELEKYTRIFTSMQREISAASEEILKNEKALGQTVQVRDQGCLALGLEIQRCKDNGVQGKKLSDFESDAGVKACVKSITEFQKQIEKEIARITALHNKDFKDLQKRFFQFKADLQAECDKRDSKKNRKVLPVDSQSLPDLKKLLGKVQKATDSGEFMRISGFSPESIKDHQDAMAKKLDDAVKQTKDLKLSKFQQQMIERRLDERVMNKYKNLAAKSCGKLLEHCDAAREAIKAGQAKQLDEHKKQAAQEFKTLAEIVDPYQRAMKDGWLKSKIKQSKEAQDGIRDLEKLYNRGKDELTKVAKVKLG